MTNGSANGLPDADNQRVVHAVDSERFNLRCFECAIFPEGNGENEIFKSFAFDGPGTYAAEGESEGGWAMRAVVRMKVPTTTT